MVDRWQGAGVLAAADYLGSNHFPTDLTPAEFKQAVYDACRATIQQRIDAANAAVQAAREATASEGKSTAGDKHETGRAMAQLEQEKFLKQLSEANKIMAALLRIDPAKKYNVAAIGSLLETSRGWFFLSAGVGKVEIEGKMVFGLSSASPIGKALHGKRAGEAITFNGQRTEIVAVY